MVRPTGCCYAHKIEIRYVYFIYNDERPCQKIVNWVKGVFRNETEYDAANCFDDGVSTLIFPCGL